MGIGAAVAGAGSLLGGVVSAAGAKSAASTQAQAYDQAAANQLKEFQQIQTQLGPYMQAGYGALPWLQYLTGTGPAVTAGAGGIAGTTAGTAGGAAVPATASAGGTPSLSGYVNPSTGGSTPTYVPAQYDSNGNLIPGTGGYSLTGAAPTPGVPIGGNFIPEGQYSGPGSIPAGVAAGAGTSAGTGAGTGGGINLASLSGTNITSPLSPGALTAPFSSSPFSSLAALQQTPGYQFTLNQGEQAVTNAMASQGLAGASGPLLKGGINYAEGLAGTTYQQQLQNYMNQNLQTYNMLAGLVQGGQNAATNVGSLGTQNVTSANQALIGAGTASAAGTIGATNALGGAASNLGQTLFLSSLLQGNNPAGAGGFSSGSYTPKFTSYAQQTPNQQS